MLVNGQSAHALPIDDRGLAYGDGVFETVRCVDGKPILWDEHLARLERGCDRLGIRIRHLLDDLTHDRDELLASASDDVILKLIITRGHGGAGYKPAAGQLPNRIALLRPYIPDETAGRSGISVSVCETRLGTNPALAGIKHLNRLEQVLGAAEIKAGCGEGLMLGQKDQVIEGTRSNIFFVRGGGLVTPALDDCGVAGTLRQWLLATRSVEIRRCSISILTDCEEMFFCNSVFGIYPVTRIVGAGMDLQLAIGAQTRLLQASLGEIGFR